MPNENKKKVTPNIDEELMMNIMSEGVKKEGLQVPQEPDTAEVNEKDMVKPKGPLIEKTVVKEKMKTKKISELDYDSIFFRRSETQARDGKTVYIRPEFHEKLTRIIQVIGEDKITIYAYLDNLLDHHFQEFGEQITKSYNEKYKPI